MAVKKKTKRSVSLINKNKINKKAPPGSSPGILTMPDDAEKPILKLYSFNAETLIEKNHEQIKVAIDFIKEHTELTHWLEIKGIGDKQLLESICSNFDIHLLEMEDVTNVYQRPKHEEHASHLFIISRMLYAKEDYALQNDQLALFCGSNFVITIQEKTDDILDRLRTRLRNGRGHMRVGGSSYLTYAINDAIIDHYFPLLERTGELLDELEDEVLTEATRQSLSKIQDTKRELIIYRRTAFAERDKLNDILRSKNEFINEDTKIYLRDTYDHIIQVIDLVDSYKEITASLMDIYLSSVSNKMNKVMKVMAVFSAVFLPLTFIVGLYGMNFARVDPETGKAMHHNMPELYNPNGYPIVLGVLLAVVLAEIWYFTRKGWMINS